MTNLSRPTRPMTTADQSFERRLEEVRQKINSLRTDNDKNESEGPESQVLLTRACACCSRDPLEGERYASVACGHAVCRACAEKAAASCPKCREPTRFVKIFEDGPRCGVCLSDQPVRRGLFSGCGHTLCDACIGQMWYNAVQDRGAFACHQCRRSSRPVRLREQKIVRPMVQHPRKNINKIYQQPRKR